VRARAGTATTAIATGKATKMYWLTKAWWQYVLEKPFNLMTIWDKGTKGKPE
jgi:hypothetical protein